MKKFLSTIILSSMLLAASLMAGTGGAAFAAENAAAADPAALNAAAAETAVSEAANPAADPVTTETSEADLVTEDATAEPGPAATETAGAEAANPTAVNPATEEPADAVTPNTSKKGAAASGKVYMVKSITQLKKDLKKNPGERGHVTFKLSASKSAYLTEGSIVLPKNVKLDLNKQTILLTGGAKYAIKISGPGSSVTNGTLKKGGILVSNTERTTGFISRVTILNAVENGIYLNGKTIGNITHNTIRNPHDFGIRVFSGSSCGNIKYNTIYGSRNHAITLNGHTGVGHHDGSSAGDITHNTITNCKGHGISLYHGSHCGKISYNKLKNLGGAHSIHNKYGNDPTGDYAITVNSGCPYKSYAKEITHNVVDGITYAGIVVFCGPEGDTAGKWHNNAYIEGDIAYNTVSRSGTDKKNVKDWTNPKKNDPVCQAAVYVDSHATVKGSIHHNTVKSSYDDGIYILAYSSVGKIYSNKVGKTGYAGIAVGNHSKVGSIYGNTVRNSRNHGLFVNSGSSITGVVSNNKFYSSKLNGIFVSKQAYVSTIRNNTITKCGSYGIITGAGGRIGNLEGNTISTTSAKNSVPIFNNDGGKMGKITNNKVSGKFHSGIRVKSPSSTVTISNNTISSSSSASGISIDSARNRILITRNKMSGIKTAFSITNTPRSMVIIPGQRKKPTKP